jgi:hypothetical protein
MGRGLIVLNKYDYGWLPCVLLKKS